MIACIVSRFIVLFFFNDPATTEIYTLSLHDALPISPSPAARGSAARFRYCQCRARGRDRKSTRLNSSHEWTSYAAFCLKKKSKKFCDVIRASNEQNFLRPSFGTLL